MGRYKKTQNNDNKRFCIMFGTKCKKTFYLSNKGIVQFENNTIPTNEFIQKVKWYTSKGAKCVTTKLWDKYSFGRNELRIVQSLRICESELKKQNPITIAYHVWNMFDK